MTAEIDPDRACPHRNFATEAQIIRITADGTETGNLIGLQADVKVMCLDCGEPMRWTGLKAGVSGERPMCSLEELSCARRSVQPRPTLTLASVYQASPSLRSSARSAVQADETDDCERAQPAPGPRSARLVGASPIRSGWLAAGTPSTGPPG